ncbi:hypothetical protein [Chromobacterium haemolyticum]|uniref:hypothetical protein n=1 Tax=Chromobacterium TaxID=535 RepID=UPI0040564151
MGIDVFEIRRVNLISLVDGKRGETARVARLIEVEPNYLSQLKKGGERKRMGDITARKIETALGLEYGWMDRSHDIEYSVAPEQAVITAQSEEELVKLLREKGEAYAFELLRKAFMEQENKKGD